MTQSIVVNSCIFNLITVIKYAKWPLLVEYFTKSRGIQSIVDYIQ